jgi:nucleoside-diphosphate-sugar epimerase
MGVHPLLLLVRDRLIVDHKMELVGLDDRPDFVVLGALTTHTVPWKAPTLVLSSGIVYSDRDSSGEVSTTKPMSETRPSVILSPLEKSTGAVLQALGTEYNAAQSIPHTLILRVFDVYGGGLHTPISTLLDEAKSNTKLHVESPGYQTRTFLHITDFYSAFDLLLKKFLSGTRGIYNLGSTEEISYKRLADSVWQLTNPQGGDTPIELVAPTQRQIWWSCPDITRIQALLGWSPTISIRKGLWLLLRERENT